MPSEVNKINRDNALDKDGKPSVAFLNLLNSLRNSAVDSQSLLDLISQMDTGDVLGAGPDGLMIISPTGANQYLFWDGTTLIFRDEPIVYVEQLWDRTLGTNIGNFNSAGGLGAAFDGDYTQTNSAGASTPGEPTNIGLGWLGKTFPTPQIISRFVYWGPDNTFINNTQGVATLDGYVKDGATPTSSTDGVLISQENTFATWHVGARHVIHSLDKVNSYDHAFVRVNNRAQGTQFCAELDIYVMVPDV